jgi:hypothetical protein
VQWLRHYDKGRKAAGLRTDQKKIFINLPNCSIRTAPKTLQYLTEMSTTCRKIMFLGSKTAISLCG